MAAPVLNHTRPGTGVTGLGLYEIEAGGIRGNKLQPGRKGPDSPHCYFCVLPALPGPPVISLLFISLLLASQGCCNKLPQTGQLETTEIYFLTILEVTHLKSRCWLSHSCWRLSVRSLPRLFQLLVAVRIPWIHWLVTTPP